MLDGSGSTGCRRIVSILTIGFLSAAGNGAPGARAPQSAPAFSPSAAIAAVMQSRLSDMGPDGDEAYDARMPAVAYNGVSDQYLVVWEGDDDADGVSGEIEIRARLIDGATGAPLGEDVRVSHMGPDGDVSYGAHHPSVAHNDVVNQYLVVWYGNDDAPGLAADELEIHGRLLDAAGIPVGPAFRVSSMGPDGDSAFSASDPKVVCNNVDNEYLVVWDGEDDTGALVAGESEIFGQLLDAAGLEIGPDDFRISDMGADGDPGPDAFDPAVAFSPVTGEYFVVWEADDSTGGMVGGEFEVFGQFIEASTGLEVGGNDFRLSTTGPDGAGEFDAVNPSVAYSDFDNEYLVVWEADGPPLPEDKTEIRGQRLDAVTGNLIELEDLLFSGTGEPDELDLDAGSPSVAYNPVESSYLVVWHADGLMDNNFEIYAQLVTFPLAGGTQFRVSDMGTSDADGQYDAQWPVVTCNAVANEFLVVWEGDDDTGELTNDEFEIYGQRISADGTEIGANDFRISTAGPDGDLEYDARSAAAAYNSIDNEYLVVWEGDDDTGSLVEGEQEIFGQRVDAATGAEIGENDFRISDMGPDGDPAYEAGEPKVAWNSVDNLYLVVWEGEDHEDGFVAEEYETWGQLIDGATGAEIGPDFRISDVGPDGLASRDSGPPAVAYDPVNNQFLVVWEADDTDVGTPNHKNEIFGQFLDGATGAEIGANDFRISDMGPNDDPDYDAREAAVAYNAVDSEFLVVWRGEDDQGGLVPDEFEIFGQRIDAVTGAETGANDFRISDMGPDGDTDYSGRSPAVAHNAVTNEYLVVWRGVDDAAGLAVGESEIYGQRLDGATGAEVGPNDFRISDMGPDGDPAFDAVEPSVAYAAALNEYLVVWEANDDGADLSPVQTEIYAQRLDDSGSEIGDNDARISVTGEDGDGAPKAADPAVAAGGGTGRYFLAWQADDGTPPLVDNEDEIFGALFGDGPLCPADLNGDGLVGVEDFLELLSLWGTDPGGPPDLDGDGTVGVTDFLALLAVWGPCG